MDDEAKEAGRRWHQWREEDARSALAEHAQSGKSLSRFARERGISLRRLMYWRKRLSETAAPEFVAVAVPPTRLSEDSRIEIGIDGIAI
jgi:transposase-like protein